MSEGTPIGTDKLHLKQLAPGVIEITSLAYTVGEWRVRLRDHAGYYGLGERFDTINHAHTVVKNNSQETPDPKGSSSDKPVPFFMSSSGYGLWCDTTGDASFDLNASSNREIVLDATADVPALATGTAADLCFEPPLVSSSATTTTTVTIANTARNRRRRARSSEQRNGDRVPRQSRVAAAPGAASGDRLGRGMSWPGA